MFIMKSKRRECHAPGFLEALNPGRMRAVPAQRTYPQELRDGATRLVRDLRKDATTSKGAISRIATQLGIHWEALRGWVN
jgi:transposase-like protein